MISCNKAYRTLFASAREWISAFIIFTAVDVDHTFNDLLLQLELSSCGCCWMWWWWWWRWRRHCCRIVMGYFPQNAAAELFMVRHIFCQESLSSAGCKLFYLEIPKKSVWFIWFFCFYCRCQRVLACFPVSTICFTFSVCSRDFLFKLLLFLLMLFFVSSPAAHVYAFKHAFSKTFFFSSFSACNK